MIPATEPHAEHFADAVTEHHAARLGMWIFLGGEVLFFAGILTLYAVARAAEPVAFAQGVDHSKKAFGTANAFILLGSTFIVSWAVEMMKRKRHRVAALLALLTAGCGVAFLILKGVEYADHIHEGLLPGVFIEQGHGAAAFWTLYWVLTLIHAFHLIIGVGLMLFFTARLLARAEAAPYDTAFENAATFWSFIDIVWILLWPLFYLMGTR